MRSRAPREVSVHASSPEIVSAVVGSSAGAGAVVEMTARARALGRMAAPTRARAVAEAIVRNALGRSGALDAGGGCLAVQRRTASPARSAPAARIPALNGGRWWGGNLVATSCWRHARMSTALAPTEAATSVAINRLRPIRPRRPVRPTIHMMPAPIAPRARGTPRGTGLGIGRRRCHQVARAPSSTRAASDPHETACATEPRRVRTGRGIAAPARGARAPGYGYPTPGGLGQPVAPCTGVPGAEVYRGCVPCGCGGGVT